MSVMNAAARPVVLIDDDADVREAMASYLEAHGHVVVCAVNGIDALNQLAAPMLPALIVLDLHMPVMDGQTFLTELEAHPRLTVVPVIVMSAGDERVDFRGRPAVVAVLAKPCEPKRLDRLIVALIEARRDLDLQ